MEEQLVPIRHLHFLREGLSDGQFGSGHVSGIECPIPGHSRNEYLFAVRACHPYKSSIDLWRIMLGDLVLDVVITASVDVQDQHVTYGTRLFGQGFLQRPLQVAFQADVCCRTEESQRSSQKSGVPNCHPKPNGSGDHESTSFSEITYPRPRMVRINLGS